MKLDAATWGAALWPAFLGAAVGDAILFTLIDPETIVLFGVHADISRPAAYTIGFFVLWLLMIATSVTTLWLSDHRRK
jgi:NADH:ubiquinone oxidoreductase subunit 3 (subunit A)